jgi:hypothetical protein
MTAIVTAMTTSATTAATMALTTVVVEVVAIRRRLGGWRSVGLLGHTTESQKHDLGGALGVSLFGGLLA